MTPPEFDFVVTPDGRVSRTDLSRSEREEITPLLLLAILNELREINFREQCRDTDAATEKWRAAVDRARDGTAV